MSVSSSACKIEREDLDFFRAIGRLVDGNIPLVEFQVNMVLEGTRVIQ